MCYSRPVQDNDYNLRVCKGCYMHVRKTVGFLWQEGWTVEKLSSVLEPPDDLERRIDQAMGPHYPDPPRATS